jgi:hypothetical protein
MPSLERLYREYRDRGLRAVAISIDDGGQVDLINEFVSEHGLTFDVLHDPKSAIMRQYPVRGVPDVLVSRSGESGPPLRGGWYTAANRALVDSLLLGAIVTSSTSRVRRTVASGVFNCRPSTTATPGNNRASCPVGRS